MATGKNINELTKNTELDDSDLLLVGNKGTGSLRQITVEDAENSALGYDSGDDTSPTAWEDVDKIESSEKAPSLFKKLTTMAKNVRWLFSKMGTTDISKIGDGTVMGVLTSLNDGLTTNTSDIASINSALTNITDGIQIERNSDLNDFIQAGYYLCPNSTVAGTLTNLPITGMAFVLLVIWTADFSGGTFRNTQIFIRNHSLPRIYARTYSSAGWSDWYQLDMTVVS